MSPFFDMNAFFSEEEPFLVNDFFYEERLLAVEEELLEAVENEDLERVKNLLKRVAHVWTQKNPKPRKVFYRAIDKKNVEILREMFLLAQRLCDPNSTEYRFDEFLLYSIREDFESGVDLFLKYEPASGARVLQRAIESGNLKTIDKLLSKGVRFGQEIEIALYWGRWDVVKYLIGRGVEFDPNICLRFSVACSDLVEFFIKKCSNKDAIQAALENSVILRCERSMQILLEHGATLTPNLVSRMSEMNLGIFGL